MHVDSDASAVAGKKAWEDYRNNMTLGEIAENDMAMFQDRFKKTKRHIFPDSKSALFFAGQCLLKTLAKLGIDIAILSPADVDEKIKKYNVVVENRNYSDDGEPGTEYSTGTYVYNNGELVDFISMPLAETPSWLEIDRTPRITVSTSVVL